VLRRSGAQPERSRGEETSNATPPEESGNLSEECGFFRGESRIWSEEWRKSIRERHFFRLESRFFRLSDEKDAKEALCTLDTVPHVSYLRR
jgi:hypothetical protein